MDCSTPSFPVFHHLPKLAQTPVHWAGEAIEPSNPLPSTSPPAFNLSQHQGLFKWVRLFTSDSQSIGASDSASVLLMNIQARFPLGLHGLVSLQSKGLKSFLQRYSSKALILLCSAFFMVQLLHPYMTTGKTTALIRRTFVGKVKSLLNNTLSGSWWWTGRLGVLRFMGSQRVGHDWATELNWTDWGWS